MNFWVALAAWPLAVRLMIVAACGLLAGVAVNWAAYSLAYQASYWSPWSRKHPRAALASRWDLAPILGWWRMRRRNSEPGFGPRFWVRPLIVECLCAVGFVAWYWWEAVLGGLLHPHLATGLIAANGELSGVLHASCFVHLGLFLVMLAASLIDADEWNIPDEVTVPGTLLGAAFLTLAPGGMLPAFFDRRLLITPLPLDAAAPYEWPAEFSAGNSISLAIGLACVFSWCGGLLIGGRFPIFHDGRKRWGVALRLFARRIRRDPWTPRVLMIGLASSLAVFGVWQFAPSLWRGLLTSLVGAAAGGAIVWSVRILGGWAFQKEAMGFGDVTLMAMIGAYLGWQPTLLIFFAAPAAALVIYIPALLIRRHEALPYGPYLCASTLGVLIFWSEIWAWAEPRFTVAWLIPAVLLAGFLILGIVMSVLRAVRK
ncbi:MAG: hypothetical protein C0483_11760 [Pirellula sp.]|nr:hypothetical protein [Pirellula sp.]